jgi:acyl-CoA thioester hydrolase
MSKTDDPRHLVRLRVRYGETDQMGTFYYARALDWLECGRTEALRACGVPYAKMEHDGILLPVIEAHICCHGRARYDDAIEVRTAITLSGKTKLRFEAEVANEETGALIVSGYTLHAITGSGGRPIRSPGELLAALGIAGSSNES